MRKISLFLMVIIVSLIGYNLNAEEISMNDLELLSVGTLSISNLYFSYLTLGTVGDSFTNGNYEPALTKSIAEETIFLNLRARNSLKELINSRNISDEDKDIMHSIIEAYNLLVHTAEALISYVDKEDNGDAFQIFRDKTWENISSLVILNR